MNGKKIPIEQVDAKVVEFQNEFLNSSLEKISRCNSVAYDVKKDWSDVFPCAEDRGVYALFHKDELLYIGSALGKGGLGNRLGSHFVGQGDPKPGDTWSKTPTHLYTYKAPSDFWFMAASLEIFLIMELRPPDNYEFNR